MINRKKVLALIPARAGSKSVPNKNIKTLLDKPLIAWSIQVALNSKYIDKVIVSTDGEEISNVSKQFGAEVMLRPNELAKDDSLVIDTVRHVLKELVKKSEIFDYLVLLEPTSPLRSIEDIDAVIEKIETGCFDSVATFVEAELNPHRAWLIENETPSTFIPGSVPWLPRQKLPKAWQLNGAVYGILVKKLPNSGISLLFGKTGAITMPKHRSLDIDHHLDFTLAEAMVKESINAKVV